VTGAALALVLAAALAHASWNLFLKKARGGPAFMTLAAAAATVIWAPAAAAQWLLTGYVFEPIHLVPIVASAVVHSGYFLLLDRGYRFGDLSVVYPLARATGPILTVIVAVAILGERPGPIALGGALLVVTGAYLLTGNPLRLLSRDRPRGTGFALLTGATIALYTVIDKIAVSKFLVPPIVFDWWCVALRIFIFLPLALRTNRNALVESWRLDRRGILVVAIFSPLAYILVLMAMVFTPVSLVAPAREMSILFAAIMGAHFLKEGDVARRLIAASAIVIGIIGLASG
jgi:drug/metabolite transporter (DMT)-like permease